LFNSYALDDNRHKAVIDTTKLATLTEEAAPAIKQKAKLIDTARTSIHFYTKSWNCSAMQNIGSGNKDTNVCANRKG
jgi:hypothetical protein